MLSGSRVPEMADQGSPGVDPSHLEAETRRIGEALSARSAGLAPSFFDSRWWSGTLLEWCFKDEAFKVQLFRFIDVLPCLRDDRQIARLIEEYFGDTGGPASPLRWGLRALSATALGARLSAKSLRKQVHQMAGSFIAGATVPDALPVLARMWRDGRAFSVDLLGEATVSEHEADRYRDRCLDALRALAEGTARWPSAPVLEQDHLGPLPRVNLSVKLSALYSQLDPVDPEGGYRNVAARLRPILDLAASLPAAVTFDMEQAELKDLFLSIFMRLLIEDAYRAYPHAGIALQAYLKDSGADLARLIAWTRRRGTPIAVRLVKGAYWDSEVIRHRERGWAVPVFERKGETDANYERLTRELLAHGQVIRPSFGTHNLRTLAHAVAAARSMGLEPHACEYQMIYGMAEPLQGAVAEAQHRLRIYTPIGEVLPGMAYLVRRLLENTANESFLRREYLEAAPLDVLLAPPDQGAGVSTAPTATSPGTMEHFVNEPHTDFSRAEARSAMARAIEDVRGRLGGTRSYESAPGLSPAGQELVSRNPSSPGQVVGRIRAVGAGDVPFAVRHAVSTFAEWRTVAPEARAAVLVQAAGIMRRRRFELAAWEIFETGKPWREADADVAEAIDFLEFYAREMRRLGRPQRLGREPGEINHLLYAPRGATAVLSPWNFPLAIPTGMVSAALVTGNPVLFKPSERAPLLGAHLVDILREAGALPGAIQLLPGGPEVGAALAGHPDIQVIAFTGSQQVGLRLIAQAAQPTPGRQSVKRVVAEMGGKNAIIVDETADLDEAVSGVMASFTGYQGQKCSACSRAIVHEAALDIFLRRLTEAVLSLPIGPAEDPASRMGPMIDARARDKVLEYIEIGRHEGRVVVERKDVPGDGYFVGPAVFTDIRPEHRLAQEEIFGPVLAVMAARDFEDALRLANSTAFALTGGVYSRSPANLDKARVAFDVGNLYLNRPITGALVGRQPFGGHRLSGVGAKAGGQEYLPQFMTARVVSENTQRRGYAPLE